MSFVMATVIFANLAILLCIRNFFIQVVAMKFVLDACFLFLCSFTKSADLLQSVAWLILSVGMVLIFLLMMAGLKKTVQNKRIKQTEIF